jgi:hypothetical protein
MFDTKLVRSDKPKQTVGQIEKVKSIANSIRFNRNNREDLATKGYKAYLYNFKRQGEVPHKEHGEFIISASDMDEAIETFKSTQLWGDRYENAVFDVKLFGVDFEFDRTDKVLMVV